MKGIFFVFSIVVFLITGCNEKEMNMPEEMPDDFDFLVQFGVGSKNEINTFNNMVTKDLITEGTISTEIRLTKEEMQTIYLKMREIKIMEPKELVPKRPSCMQIPYREDKWEIRVKGETQKLYWSGEYCENTKDAKQLIDLRNTIVNIVKRKAEYKKLPEAKGGYQ